SISAELTPIWAGVPAPFTGASTQPRAACKPQASSQPPHAQPAPGTQGTQLTTRETEKHHSAATHSDNSRDGGNPTPAPSNIRKLRQTTPGQDDHHNPQRHRQPPERTLERPAYRLAPRRRPAEGDPTWRGGTRAPRNAPHPWLIRGAGQKRGLMQPLL